MTFKKYYVSMIVLLLGIVSSATVQAVTMKSLTWQPPGGVTWNNTGGGNVTEGGTTWSYTNFDTSQFDQLYWGLNQLDYGPAGAGLDGTLTDFSFISVSGNTATWAGATTWYDSIDGTTPIDATIRYQMTLVGGGSWITDLASIGLDGSAGYGDLGAVANIGGADFSVELIMEADLNNDGNWIALNGPGGVQQHSSRDGATRSSFATTFYYTEPSPVPELGSLALFGLGLLVLGVFRRRV